MTALIEWFPSQTLSSLQRGSKHSHLELASSLLTPLVLQRDDCKILGRKGEELSLLLLSLAKLTPLSLEHNISLSLENKPLRPLVPWTKEGPSRMELNSLPLKPRLSKVLLPFLPRLSRKLTVWLLLVSEGRRSHFLSEGLIALGTKRPLPLDLGNDLAGALPRKGRP